MTAKKKEVENWACCAYGAQLCPYCGTIHCVHQCCDAKWQVYLKRWRELERRGKTI